MYFKQRLIKHGQLVNHRVLIRFD